MAPSPRPVTRPPLAAQGDAGAPYIETSPQNSPRVGDFSDTRIINPAAVREFQAQERVDDAPAAPARPHTPPSRRSQCFVH